MTIDFESFTTEPAPDHRPKRRAAAVLGASMLVAAAGGVGFGLGRSGGTGDSVTAPAGQPVAAPSANPSRDAGTDATMNRNGGTTNDTVAPVVPDEAPPAAIATEGDFGSSGGGGWTTFGNQPMDLIAERVTDDGITLRAHLGELWDYGSEDEYWGGPDGWRPAAWCYESGQVRIAMAGGTATGTDVIDVGAVSWWSEPFQGRAISWLTLGAVDDNPHRVVFVQAPSDTTSVTVTHSDGATDTVTPTNGVAMLIVPGAPETVVHEEDGPYSWVEERPDFDVTFNGPSPITVDGAQTSTWDNPEYQEACSPPPPALPVPGEQPVDAATAEQTIVDLMTTIYSDADGAANEDRIDDITGIAEAREQVRNGGFADQADSAAAIIEELVFTSPTEAWFRYRIETSLGDFGGRYGIAVNIDGVWKITRDTICQDLAMAGGDCGNSSTIYPPGYGWEE